MRLSTSDRRYRLPAQKRKFGGKVYEYLMAETTKAEANRTADNWRRRGYGAVVVPFGRNYSVYTRRPKN